MSTEEPPDERPLGVARPRSRLSRFLWDRSGSTAIEFVALALPFAALVFAILESCISFAGQEVLTNVTDDIARKMRTGQIRPTDVDETKLRKMICDRLKIIVSDDCPGLAFDLQEVTTFEEAVGLGSFTKPLTVQLGTSGTKNVLRVTYTWPAITDYANWLKTGSGDTNAATHFAMAVWQNEPFDD